MIILHVLILAISFYLLAIVTEEFFVESLDRLAKRLRLSHEAAGATLMAVGSSAPELFTSLFAVLKPGNHADVGAGTIVGSAIFNILVIVGASAMFRRAYLTWQVAIRDLLFYIGAILLLLYSFWDGQIVLFEAMLFLAVYTLYIIAVTNWSGWFSYKEQAMEIVETQVKKHPINARVTAWLARIIPDPNGEQNAYIRSFLISVVLIGVLSFIMVESAVALAQVMHVAPAIIALTILAFGTSIPDLLSSIIVAKQGRGDMAVSNAVGSNIFDILFGLGAPWVIVILWKGQAIGVGTENLLSSVFLLFATVLAVVLVLAAKRWQIGKRAGFLLVIVYVAYLIYQIFEAVGYSLF